MTTFRSLLPAAPDTRCSCCGEVASFTCRSCHCGVSTLDCWCPCTFRAAPREPAPQVRSVLLLSAPDLQRVGIAVPRDHYHFGTCSQHGVVPHRTEGVPSQDFCLWCDNSAGVYSRSVFYPEAAVA